MGKKKIVCDHCGKAFIANDIKVEEEKLTGDRVGLYFKCPLCGYKYSFASITKRGQKLKEKLKSKVKQINKASTEKSREHLLKQYRQLQQQYQREVKGQYNETEVLDNEQK